MLQKHTLRQKCFEKHEKKKKKEKHDTISWELRINTIYVNAFYQPCCPSGMVTMMGWPIPLVGMECKFPSWIPSVTIVMTCWPPELTTCWIAPSTDSAVTTSSVATTRKKKKKNVKINEHIQKHEEKFVFALLVLLSLFLSYAWATHSAVSLCDHMDCSLLGSSVCGILQARILEWDAMPSSRGSSQTSDQTQVSCTAGRFFTIWAPREAIFLIQESFYMVFKFSL